MVFVTKPFLPPLSEFTPLMESIWNSGVLTNCGPYHQRFERELCEYLGVEHISVFSNATIALITALQCLEIKGQVITTPFSFVATSHALLWNGLEPVFVDVESRNLNMDPSKIENAITSRTTAILPVHCYGHPCDVDAIDQIARRRGLKVIYDAAHAFGVNCHCGSVLQHGDLSVLSFHATKVFNTFEGGAIICRDAKKKQRIDQLKNFGHDGEASVLETGINGKMSEFGAALGVLQLKYIDEAIRKRKAVSDYYDQAFTSISGLTPIPDAGEARRNYSYYPLLVDKDYPLNRDEVYDFLKLNGFHTRKYFFPLISEHPMYSGFASSARANLPIAWDACRRVLCVPIYPDLSIETAERLIGLLKIAGSTT
jgi:dTDP-4-amino-4,6-dideoxygalactose transaminase